MFDYNNSGQHLLIDYSVDHATSFFCWVELQNLIFHQDWHSFCTVKEINNYKLKVLEL
jgi:hypothetical protein